MAKGIAARTDFDPALYETVGYFYIGEDEETAYEYSLDHRQLEAKLGYAKYEELLDAAGACDSCGTRYAHGAVIRQYGTGDFLTIGQVCAYEYFGIPSVKEFKAKEAKKAKERKALKAKAEAFIADENLDEVFAHTWLGKPVDKPEDGDYYTGYAAGTTYDIRSKIFRYGYATEGQLRLLRKLHAEYHERKAEREAEAAEAPPVAIPAEYLEGRSTIEATLLGTKVQDGYYGSTLKMLVKVETDGGSFKLWGTVPSKLSEYDDEGNYLGFQKGDKVRFDAAVEQSKDDEAFGFFSRPTKPSIDRSGRPVLEDAEA